MNKKQAEQLYQQVRRAVEVGMVVELQNPNLPFPTDITTLEGMKGIDFNCDWSIKDFYYPERKRFKEGEEVYVIDKEYHPHYGKKAIIVKLYDNYAYNYKMANGMVIYDVPHECLSPIPPIEEKKDSDEGTIYAYATEDIHCGDRVVLEIGDNGTHVRKYIN